MTIQQAQEIINQWIKEYGVRYFNELTNTAISSVKTANSATKIMLHFAGISNSADWYFNKVKNISINKQEFENKC